MPVPLIFAAQGLAQLGIGAVNAYQANKQRKTALADKERALEQYRSQDTSNLYSNLENPYEDLTVNQGQAQFQAQQQQQGLADTMSSMRGAAGGSGIASFAQVLANQQATNAQAASVSIGQQEMRNQSMQAGGAMQIQGMERGGEERARALRGEIISTDLGMSMNELAGANAARQQAYGNIASGLGNVVAGGVGMYQASQGNTPGADMGQPMANLTNGITQPTALPYDPNADDKIIGLGGYTPSYQ
jgi:hypothetical protein